MKKKVLVAMSGGVDSSVAAALLLEQGYEVAGATMKLWPKGKYFDGTQPPVEEAARKIARELGVPHFTFDFSEEFESRVVRPFAKAYELGLTPNPCVFCNRHLKFGAFFDRADQMGFDAIATGHYACIEKGADGIFRLFSRNEAKDQTYVLYPLGQRVLSRLLLPVGGMEKKAIREYAKRSGLSCAASPDSQDICFIPDDDYCRLLERLGCKASKGDFVDTSGKVIGQHKGIIHYTIGQRKGLGAFGTPKYVLSLDWENNRVVLGENSELFGKTLFCREVNWLDGKAPEGPVKAQVKIRYTAGASDASVIPEGGGARVEFDAPQRAITPGQSAVFYEGNRLLGGGIITASNFYKGR